MATIKETMDVFTMAKAAAVAIKAAKADGRVDWKDLLSQESRALLPAVQAAVKDSQLIAEELKDLNQEEAKLLASSAVEVVWLLVDAVMA